MAPSLSYSFTLRIPPGEWDANDWANNPGFGNSVAIGLDKIVVACYFKYVTSLSVRCGAVYVFDRNGTHLQSIYPENVADQTNSGAFGSAIAMSGNWLAIVAGGTDYVYFYEWTGSAFTYRQRITGSTTVSPGDAFGGSSSYGKSLAISGSTCAVGAPNDDDNGTDSGSVFIIRESGGTWSEDQIIAAPNTQNSQRFGGALDLDGSVLVVSAPYYNDTISNEGQAYVYEDSGSSFSKVADLKATDTGYTPSLNNQDLFGNNVAVSGDIIGVGWWAIDDPVNASGALCMWQKSGGVWSHLENLTLPETPFGTTSKLGDWGGGYPYNRTVALAGTALAGGAPFYDEDGGSNEGAGFLWSLASGSFSYIGYDYTSDSGKFGSCIEVSNNLLAISGPDAHAGLGTEPDTGGVVRILDILPGSRFTIGEDGGYEMEIEWVFSAHTALEVFLGPSGDDTDLACYGGEGNAYYPVSEDGSTVTVYSPKILAGDYQLSWREAGGGTPELCGYVTVLDQNFKTSIHRARRSHQVWSDVGPRRLELEQ